MHPYKELQQVAGQFAKQLKKTLNLLAKIQESDDFDLDDELIAQYENEKAGTEVLSKRFKELIEINKNSN